MQPHSSTELQNMTSFNIEASSFRVASDTFSPIKAIHFKIKHPAPKGRLKTKHSYSLLKIHSGSSV